MPSKQDLFARLEARLEHFTPAERQIANHMLSHRNELPFETADSLAKKLGVSAVTVGRFCRLLGYKHFRAIKEEMRKGGGSAPWLVGDQLTQYMDRFGDQEQLRRSLETEVAALVEVYGMVDTPAWKAATNVIVRSDLVQIAGFQTERGLALLLANLLQYVREGVQLVDMVAGTYSDVFTTQSKARCLILLDMRRYSKQSLMLAEKAAERSIPLIIITDKYCDWGSRYTPHVFALPSEGGHFWSSAVAMNCFINLFVTSVAARSGKSVEKQLEQISELFEHFTGFVGPSKGRKGSR
ncbi:MurR/RpiR family transcriptional regulator [Steroidobacter sp.]|uniref:MurR/RpiR family transcriptional regulator n=1 Tax=Steroidobacter sp. TaxID=1978227 RepID=UPI001A502AA4|nr:MurR/RpiR family transcriptional regulator [Steroidobacter sp.]MBL8268570.1 MurR/RpiR family transcriptional regulator [Steroidobacter sp.]